MPGPGGSIMHAEIKIGDSIIMLGEEMTGIGSTVALDARRLAGGLCLYFPDVDDALRSALGRRRDREAAGAGPVLRRPQRHHHRSLWPRLDDRDAHRGRRPRPK